MEEHEVELPDCDISEALERQLAEVFGCEEEQ